VSPFSFSLTTGLCQNATNRLDVMLSENEASVFSLLIQSRFSDATHCVDCGGGKAEDVNLFGCVPARIPAAIAQMIDD